MLAEGRLYAKFNRALSVPVHYSPMVRAALPDQQTSCEQLLYVLWCMEGDVHVNIFVYFVALLLIKRNFIYPTELHSNFCSCHALGIGTSVIIVVG